MFTPVCEMDVEINIMLLRIGCRVYEAHDSQERLLWLSERCVFKHPRHSPARAGWTQVIAPSCRTCLRRHPRR